MTPWASTLIAWLLGLAAAGGLSVAHGLIASAPRKPGVSPMSLSPQLNIFPGNPKYPLSFIVPNFFEGQTICDILVPQKPPGARRPICKGEQSAQNDLRQYGREHPMECLKDKLLGPGGIYARACMMCNVKQLDNLVWTSQFRPGLPCSDRYKVLNRFAVHIARGDIKVVEMLHKSTAFIENNMPFFKTVDAALDAHGTEMLEGSANFSDTNHDGQITRKEAKAYLQAVYVIADDVHEVAIAGNHDAQKLQEWTTFEMNDWVEFAPGFRA